MNFNKQRRTKSVKNSSYNIFNSTEKWGRKSNETQARYSDIYDEDFIYETKDVKNEIITDWICEFFGRQSQDSNTEPDEEIHLNIRQTMILSTLVPDELLGLKNLNTPQSKRFVGVLLMADVSGYTALSEKYNSMGETGTYRLTATLNGYIGALVELIYSHGGDIIKFAGDAFLALFKTDKKSFMYHTIHNVICCALIIQHSYGDYDTDVKVNLRVKLAISAGNITFATIGSNTDMNYVIIGLPVLEAKQAEAVCTSGKVTLAPTAWAHCYPRNYIYKEHHDGYVNINAILYDPRESDVTKPFAGIGSMVRHVKTHSIDESEEEMRNCTFNRADIMKKSKAFDLRKNIFKATQKNIGKYIRNFMIRPVLTQIDAHQPIEYLTEMRQVSVLFLTFKPKECSVNQLITIVDNAYSIICTIVYKSMGCVNKIILFDKDVMILVIFGLRGFKHESEAQAALKCACSIRKSISELDGVLRASVGVTTGVVYCGVVGHALRREFTVIGAVVNKAARLMCNYHNKVTCDETTYIKSKMSSNGFTLMPTTTLKGIQKPGKIYEYSEEIRVKVINDILVIQKLLDRTNETKIFNDWIDKNLDFDALLVVGETRIGKTRLLQWFKRCSYIKGMKTCCVRLSTIHASTPYLALAQIIDIMLKIPEDSTNEFAKEEAIVKLLGQCDPDLCYLNKVIKVRFAYHDAVYSTTPEKRIDQAKKLFKNIITTLNEKYLIVFDDLQNLDAASWDFVEVLLTTPQTLILMSLNRVKLSPVHSWITRVLSNDRIKKILIGQLSQNWIPPLACQILDVDAITSELYDALKLKCHGMPGIVENFLVHLYSSGGLEIKTISEQHLLELEALQLIFPKPDLLQPIALNANDQEQLDLYFRDTSEEKEENDIKVCLVADSTQLLEDIGSHNFDVLVMMQIDSLTPYQQLLLKIASVIGNILSRDLLENIMYENNALMTAKAIKKLFDICILGCAQVNEKRTRLNSGSTYKSSCDCQFDYDPDCNLPKYAFCKVIIFRNKLSRNTCYELLPMNQKKEFHTRIVTYLETKGRPTCFDCGGELTVVQATGNFKEVEATDNRVTMKTRNSENEPENELKNHSLSTSISESDGQVIKENPDTYKYMPIIKTQSQNGQMISRNQTKRVTISEAPKYQYIDVDEIEILNNIRTIMESKSVEDWQKFGVKDSIDNICANNKITNKDKFLAIPIKKGISQINFENCRCDELNILNYDQLAYHATRADMNKKALHFLMEHCHYALHFNKHHQVIPKLEEAEELAHQLKYELRKQKYRQVLGRIHSLKSYAFLLQGNIFAARFNVNRAADIYGIRFHKISKVLKTVRNIGYKLKNTKALIKNLLYRDIVFFYNVATLFYTIVEEEKTAKQSSLAALDLVSRIKCRVSDLLDVFSNALQVDIDRGFIDATIATEKIIRNTIRGMKYPFGPDELQSVGKLYVTLFRAQLCRGDLVSAIRSGYRASAISLFLDCKLIFLDVAPELFYALLSRGRIYECFALLRVIARLKQTIFVKDMIQESETWYYALCIDVILDGGFQIESPQDIHQYGEEILKNGTCSSNDSKYRLLTGLWVYWLRINSDNSRIFEGAVIEFFENRHSDESLCGLLTSLRFAEGMLESLTKKMDDLKKVIHIMELRSVAERELGKLERDSELMRVVHPRWLLLKAHCLNLCGHNHMAAQKYTQAYDLARLLNNKLERETVKCVSTSTNFWVHSARVGNFIPWIHITEHINQKWQLFMYHICPAKFVNLN